MASLRQTMDTLHTWAGVVFSALLFLVFFMGSLAVFDREIDRWMMPATRLEMPSEVSFDRQALPHLLRLAPHAAQWQIVYPSPRDPTLIIAWREGKDKDRTVRHINPHTGDLLPDVGTWGGSQFFYPFHYSFHLKWKDIGYWMLAVVGIGMLVLIISGVVIHKKIFADLFSFRPDKARQRITLDLHNITGVFILPFHFLITLSGLIIFIFIYFKPAIPLLYGKDMAKATQEAFGQVIRPPSKQAGTLGSVDAMVKQAQALWGGGAVRNVNISNPGDANAVVQILRRPDDQVGAESRSIYFDAQHATVLGQENMSRIPRVQRFFVGMHMIQFAHWWLRWLYFLMGLGGCVLIASGLVLWVEKRRQRHARDGRRSYRTVDALACTSTLGVVLATVAMLVGNRLLPQDLENRATYEASVYFSMWILSLIHAFWHARHALNRRAWLAQSQLLAVLAPLAVALNAVTTGDHLFTALPPGQWAVAGVDLVLLLAGLIAALAARRLRRIASAQETPKPLARTMPGTETAR